MIISILSSETISPLWGTIIALLACTWPIRSKFRGGQRQHNVPYVNAGLSACSSWLASLMFMINPLALLRRGHVQFSNKAYRYLRLDGDVTVLPPSAIAEFSSLPSSIADGTRALEHDLLGSYTGLDFIVHSRLHHRVVQRKITPNLGTLAPGLQEELCLAVEDIMPRECEDDWRTVQLYPLLLKITARAATRAFVGTSFCRNEAWLHLATSYVEDLFKTIVILRAFPSWLRPAVAPLTPSFWRGKRYLRQGLHLLGPYIQARLDAKNTCQPPVGISEDQADEPCALNWLIDMAEGADACPERIAHAEVLLSLAGIHTMVVRQLSVIYDVTSHPEYLPILRDEIMDVASSHPNWSKSSYAALQKMDSFMRESQRVSPPTILGLKRVMVEPYTLADGTHLAKGAYVCVDTYNIENDPRNTPNPETFDGLRHCDTTGSQQGSHVHSFAATELTVLNFGHGKTACPGRHFASLFIKMSMVKILSEYDFEFLSGTERPQNHLVHEFLFTNPWAKIRMRKRPRSDCPF